MSKPGEYPFTSGIYKNMYRGRLWTMRQYAGFASAQESNERYRYLLAAGTTGLSVAFDLPTQLGLDPDDPLSLGEVGKVGVSIATIDDMRVLFKDLPLDKISTSMTINAPAMMLLALYILVAEENGVPRSELNGTIQNDILKEYIARGTYIYPAKQSLRLITDIFSFCAEQLPSWNTISISGYHIREAGATAAQEIAFTLANAKEYIRAAQKAGLNIDDFAPRLSFFFAAHNDIFEETAKFRAARRMFAKMMREEFKTEDPKSQMMRFHTQTGGSTLQAQQPELNIVRTAYQALAAVLGGTQSLHTNAFDEALGLPTPNSAKIALRTQQVLAFESGVTTEPDPLAGSFYIERLTDQLETEAQKIIEKIDNLGGSVAAIENGFIQREIEESAWQFQRGIENNEHIIVGLNRFVDEEKANVPIQKIDGELERMRQQELKQFRQQRNQTKTDQSLENLKNAANSNENLFPFVIEAFKEKATLGEICGVFRQIWGEFTS